MSYDLYPAVDEDYNFPPEVRVALSKSIELRNTVIPMTQTVRNNLTGDELWDGRLIMNTTTNRIDRYDVDEAEWIQVTTEPAGVVKEYCGDTAPDFHVLADGSLYPRSGIYAALFAVCGTKFNTGGEDGSHFRVVNKTGRVGVGVDSSDSNLNVVGEVYGAKTVTLTEAQMPAHDHGAATGDDTPDHGHGTDTTSTNGAHAHYENLGDDAFTNSGGSLTKSYVNDGDLTDAAGDHSHSVTVGGADTRHHHPIPSDGGGGAHNNMQPSIAMNYIITL